MSQKTLTSTRLQLIFATDETGSTRSMSFSRLRLDATTDEYHAAAIALGDLCAQALQGVRLVETNELSS